MYNNLHWWNDAGHIFQILFMLAVAALLGYLLHWLLNKGRVARLVSRVESFERRFEKMNGQVLEHDNSIDRFRSDYDSQTKDFLSRFAIIPSLEEKFLQFVGFRDDIEPKVNSIRSDFSSHKSEYDELSGQFRSGIDTNKTTVGNLSDKIASFQKGIDGNKSEISSLSGTLKDHGSKIAGAVAGVSALSFAHDLTEKIENVDNRVSNTVDTFNKQQQEQDNALKSLQGKGDYAQEISSLRGMLQEQETQLAKLRQKLSDIKDYSAPIDELRNRIGSIKVTNYDGPIKTLQERVSSLKVKDYDAPIQALQERVSNLKVKDYDAPISRLQSSIEELRQVKPAVQSLKQLQDDLAGRITRVDRDNKAQDEKLAKLLSQPAPKPVAKAPAPKPVLPKLDSKGMPSAPIVQNLSIANISVAKGEKDDLKRIKGVGPFIEKKVNALGIYTFRQISKLNSKDIDMITDAIQFFPGGIKRDDWVTQAAELAKTSNA